MPPKKLLKFDSGQSKLSIFFQTGASESSQSDKNENTDYVESEQGTANPSDSKPKKIRTGTRCTHGWGMTIQKERELISCTVKSVLSIKK